MFENLTEKLERAIKVLKGQGQVTEINVAETVKEIRRALLDADVSYKVAKEFTDRVKQKALGQNVINAISPGQLFIKITHDELVELMGSTHSEISLKGNPSVVMMAGLQGSGKTTFTAKLAKYLKERKGRKPLMVACDIYRPAAIDQLHVLGEQIGIEVYSERDNQNVLAIAQKAIQYARQKGYDVVLIDTAGRLAIDEEMMQEIETLKKQIKPSETLFVVDAMTGQDAVNTAKAFNERIDFDGVVLTKLDGDARGGAALSIKAVVNKPIKFIGTGEKPEAIDVFYPRRMADRILGMGDVVTLVERAQQQFDEEKARQLQKKLAKNRFDFNDFLEQIQQIKKMGNMKELVSMIPGASKALKNIEIGDDAFKYVEAIIYSMTPEERRDPKILNTSRRKRIARGSGTSIEEVNKLIKQFEDTAKLMRMFSNKTTMANMMKNMARMKGGRPF